MSNLRLKKAFGLALDDEPRKPGKLLRISAIFKITFHGLVIDMAAILNCDIESKIILPSPLSSNAIALASLSELSMSPTLRAPMTPDRAYTPVLPPEPLKSSSPIREIEIDEDREVFVQREESVEIQEEQSNVGFNEEGGDKNVETKDGEQGEEKTNLFYDPDDDERPAVVLEEPADAKYVPPFNNPVYPNSNFNFASTIGE